MAQHHNMVSLGFTNEPVPAGTHICLVYNNEEERTDALLKFLLAGLKSKERTACFAERLTEETVRSFLEKNGISYSENKSSTAITISGTSEVYFQDGKFNPERMLNLLSAFYAEAKKIGFSGSRVIGEMTSEIQNVPGGERLLEYESRVSMLLREYPITTVCQYNANHFDGATIMEVLKVHPKMLVNGAVINNPFFIKPEDYLKES